MYTYACIDFRKMAQSAATALESGDRSGWHWGGISETDGGSRMLFTHSNCIDGRWGKERYLNKVLWFQVC